MLQQYINLITFKFGNNWLDVGFERERRKEWSHSSNPFPPTIICPHHHLQQDPHRIGLYEQYGGDQQLPLSKSVFDDHWVQGESMINKNIAQDKQHHHSLHVPQGQYHLHTNTTHALALISLWRVSTWSLRSSTSRASRRLVDDRRVFSSSISSIALFMERSLLVALEAWGRGSQSNKNGTVLMHLPSTQSKTVLSSHTIQELGLVGTNGVGCPQVRFS